MAFFHEIKPRFWDTRSGYLAGRPLTDDAARTAEHVLGVKLPAAYIELLQIQNGGVVAEGFTAYPSAAPTSWSGDHVPFGDMLGVGPGSQTILDSPSLTEEWGMPTELVLLAGDGHWWIALDYRVCGPSGEPSVLWYDNDVEEDILLAPDFSSFIEGLRAEAEADFEDDATSFDPERLPADDVATAVQSPIAAKIESLRGDLAVLMSGERTLVATKAWLMARPAEVFARLPDHETALLRAAVARIDTVSGAELEGAVEAVIGELEALMARWLTLPDTIGGFHDAEYMRERGLG